MRFSIIIPTYNRAYIIDRAIKSILNQTFKNFEIVVVDDNSSDNTFEIVNSFDDKRIKYYKNDVNLGQIKNIKKGVELSKGEFIILLADDDYYGNNESLELANNLIDKHNLEAILIEHKIDNGFLIVDNYKKDLPEVFEGLWYLKNYYWEVLNLVIKKDKFLELDLYNGNSFFSEMEAQDLVCMNCKKVGYLKDFYVVFEVGEENLNKFKINIYDFAMSINYLKRPYFYALNKNILSKNELNEIYIKRFKEYHLKIVTSIVGEKYKLMLIKLNKFYIENIEEKDIDKFLEAFAKTLKNLYQENINKEIEEYKKYLSNIKQSKQKLKNAKKIIIYGTKEMAKSIYFQYKDKVVAFVDDFYEGSFLNKPVLQKESLKNIDYDIIILATNKFEYIKQMQKNLPKEKIVYVF